MQCECAACWFSLMSNIVYSMFVRSMPIYRQLHKTEECICRFGRQTCCERSTSTSYWAQTVREIFKNTRYFQKGNLLLRGPALLSKWLSKVSYLSVCICSCAHRCDPLCTSIDSLRTKQAKMSQLPAKHITGF